MTRLLHALMMSDHPATVENLGVPPEPTPEVDYEEFDRSIGELFDRGKKKASKKAPKKASKSSK